MAAAGPHPAAPAMAAGVSGGADSLALAVLADAWVRGRGGTLTAIVVDHGIRPASADETRRTVATLARLGIAARPHRLTVVPGPALQERARAARFAAFAETCRSMGLTDLLLGHHADDQAETVLMRAHAGTGPRGRAGMALVRHTRDLRVIRPLLGVAGADLRALLRARGVPWIDDPSNTDPAFLRARLRGVARDGSAPLLEGARMAAAARAAAEGEAADWLACHAMLSPLGYALIPDAPAHPGALASLLRVVGGRRHAPASAATEALAARPRAATLGGARILPAGRLGPGWLMVREAAALAAAVPATAGARWDGRFRLGEPPSNGLAMGAVGAALARVRRRSGLPAAVLATLPALWRGDALVAVPHLDGAAAVAFDPDEPAAGAPFVGK